MSDGKVVFEVTGDHSGIDRALQNATNSISRQTAKWTVLGQAAFNGLTNMAGKAMQGIAALAKNSFAYNASMESYLINFRTLLGSEEAAAAKVAELKKYAAETPFAMDDLAGATQTLLAFGISSDEASTALKYLGDISLGDANKLSSLTLAFAQVSSAGKLAGQDLLQMINAGFNPLNIIAEKTGAAYADLRAVMSGEKTSDDFKLRVEAARKEVEELGDAASMGAQMLVQMGNDGQISADLVLKAMELATSKGGIFYQALSKASKSALGQLATIEDGWNMLIGNLGKGGFDYLSQGLFPKVISWLDKLNAAFEKNGLAGIKAELPAIMTEIGKEVLDVASTIYAAIYEALTGKAMTTDEAKAKIQEVISQVGAFFTKVNEIVDIVKAMLDKAKDWLGLDKTDPLEAAAKAYKGFSGWDVEDAKLAATYIFKQAAHLADSNNNNKYKERNTAAKNLQKAIGQEENTAFAAAVNELLANYKAGDPVQIPAEWMEGTEQNLQSALGAMGLRVAVQVDPVLNSPVSTGLLSNFLNGFFGQTHAAGGIFPGTTKFLHTAGESGPEAILPLDTLWRKMGMSFDQAFADNLGALQYSVLPSIPAADPSGGIDSEALGNVIAEKVAAALANISIEMDKRKVGMLLVPVVSQEIADEANRRKWTS